MAANPQPRIDSPQAAANPTESRELKREPTKEELRLLLAEPFSGRFADRNRLVCHLYGNGMHAADFVRISVDDLRDTGVVLVGTKMREEKFITLPRPVQDALQAYLRWRDAQVARRNLKTKSLIFGPTGKRPRSDIIPRIVNSEAKRKGLRGWKRHALNKLSREELVDVRATHRSDLPGGRMIVCFLCGICMQNLGSRTGSRGRPRTNHLWQEHRKELGAETAAEAVSKYIDYCVAKGWGYPRTVSLCQREKDQEREQQKLTDEEKALRIRCPVLNTNGQPCGALMRHLSKHLVAAHKMPPSRFRRDYPDVPLVIPSISAGSRSRLEATRKITPVPPFKPGPQPDDALDAEIERLYEAKRGDKPEMDRGDWSQIKSELDAKTGVHRSVDAYQMRLKRYRSRRATS